MASSNTPDSLAVLVSGGLDSAVLLGLSAREHAVVVPLYVRAGLTWEDAELAHLQLFVSALDSRSVRPLVILEVPVNDLYGSHWSTTGRAPDSSAPDEEFYLPGRNVLLLSKALIWCRLHEVPAVALAVLDANPFPDATPEFFHDFAAIVGKAVGGEVRIETPFAGLSKTEVVRRGKDLPLQHTLSCMNPANGRHCGVCGKCGERGRAFRDAGVKDPTNYDSRAWETMEQRAGETQPWKKN